MGVLLRCIFILGFNKYVPCFFTAFHYICVDVILIPISQLNSCLCVCVFFIINNIIIIISVGGNALEVK